MKIIIDIDEEDFEIMKHNIAVDNPLCPISQEKMVAKIANGISLDKLRTEIEKAIWENAIISFNESDIEARIPRIDPDDILKIIDKYRTENKL